jgi:hypothetical protein
VESGLSTATPKPPLRDLASESLDGFACRGHSLDRDIIGRALNASVGGFPVSRYFPLNSVIFDIIQNVS